MSEPLPKHRLPRSPISALSGTPLFLKNGEKQVRASMVALANNLSTEVQARGSRLQRRGEMVQWAKALDD